ncbi:FtsX-like permease family protein [Streptomyces sp. NPDC003077]|uniref:FtsX-like permease family protein n=1 Tax=Streptomyces sp. NPDC003077 TaxID=3154443 RepID=UPI0033B81C0F
MTGVRLLVRVLRGGGASGLVRLALMVGGIAVGVVVMVLLATMPGALEKRSEISAARVPLPVTEHTKATGSPFTYGTVQGAWGGKRFQRVLLAAGRDAARPPGVPRVPRAGQVVLSPAAKALAAEDERFARLVPGEVVGEISPSGLLGPDELYAYVGVPAEQIAEANTARGWGGLNADAEVRDRFSEVPLQLALITTAPAIIYLNVCARLSTVSRTRRYAALRLIGMSRRHVLRLAAMESATAGFLGALLGLVLYSTANPYIGPSGIVGFSWYADTARVSAPIAALTVVTVTLAAGFIGSKNTSKALAKPLEARTEGAENPPKWWHALPFALGIGLVAFPVLAADTRTQRGSATATEGILVIAGVVLTAVGLLFALRPALAGLARWIARSRLPLAARLAARKIEHESHGLSWHLSGLVLLVLVASIGAGVLHQVELASSPSTGPTAVAVEAREVPAAARNRLLSLPADARWTSNRSITPETPPETAPQSIEDEIRSLGAQLVTADCRTVRRVTGQSLEDCRDGARYRVAMGAEEPIPAGMRIDFRDRRGTAVQVSAPADLLKFERATAFTAGPTLLEIADAPRLGITQDTRLWYRLPSDISSIDRFASDLAGAAPAAMLRAGDLDLDGLEDYRVHRGTVDTGIGIAFLLGITAFLVSAIGRSLERRRDITSLVVVGVPARTLRAVQEFQLLVPLCLALGLAAVTGWLSGNAVLQLQGQQLGWYMGTLDAAGPLIAVAIGCAAVIAAFTVGARPRPEDLRRE